MTVCEMGTTCILSSCIEGLVFSVRFTRTAIPQCYVVGTSPTGIYSYSSEGYKSKNRLPAVVSPEASPWLTNGCLAMFLHGLSSMYKHT